MNNRFALSVESFLDPIFFVFLIVANTDEWKINRRFMLPSECPHQRVMMIDAKEEKKEDKSF